MEPLDDLFTPSVVAVIGATDRAGSVGRAVCENIERSFDGKIIYVNPHRDTVFDRSCRDELAPGDDVDLGIVVVPAESVIPSIREAAHAGVRTFVVLSAGFEEAGTAGAERTQKLETLTATENLTIVGPNSLGVISTAPPLNATFGPSMPPGGNISFFSQSGAFITAVLGWAIDQDLGFRHIVSLGNKLDVDESTLLRAWNLDDQTDVIVGYLESIDRGRKFIEAARDVTSETPVILIKAGRSEMGARAASSHTGAIAGSDRVVDAAMEQSGVIRVETASELLESAQLIAGQPDPTGPNVGIVSNAGGPGVLAADALAGTPLELAAFSPETIDTLRNRLPPTADPYNPIDIIGDADRKRFADTLDIVSQDPAVDMVLVLSAPVALMTFEELATEITAVADHHEIPTTACLMGGHSQIEAAATRLHESGIPTFFDPMHAVSAMATLERHRQASGRHHPQPADDLVAPPDTESLIDRMRQRDSPVVGLEMLELLAKYGITVAEGELATDIQSAEEIAQALDGDRVVMKIVSSDISHKTDVGGVRLGVSVSNVADTFEELIAHIERIQPDASIRGVYVQEQCDTDEAVEVIVGANRDPQFGPTVLFGLGGIFVEMLEDVTVRVTPIDESVADDMLDAIDAAPILHGARGQPPIDRSALCDVLVAISRLMDIHEEILELDLNPVLATPDGAIAVDVRMTLDTR